MDSDILDQLRIRTPQLADALEQQAPNQALWGERAAMASRCARDAKLHAETVEAQLFLEYANIEKPVEWRVTAHVHADMRRVLAWQQYNEAQCNADILEGVVKAFAGRREALNNISANLRGELKPLLK